MSMTATLNIRAYPEEIALWKRAAHGKLAPWVRDALNQAALAELDDATIIFDVSHVTEEGAEDADSASGWIAGPPHRGS